MSNVIERDKELQEVLERTYVSETNDILFLSYINNDSELLRYCKITSIVKYRGIRPEQYYRINLPLVPIKEVILNITENLIESGEIIHNINRIYSQRDREAVVLFIREYLHINI